MASGKNSSKIYLLLVAALVGGGCLIGALNYFREKYGPESAPIDTLAGHSGSIGSVESAGSVGSIGSIDSIGTLGAASPSSETPPRDLVNQETATQMRAANDQAVKLIGQGKIDEAIAILEPLLRRHPRYVRARENLCTAYNNKVVSGVKNNALGLDLLRKAVSLNADNPEAVGNLNTLLKCTGRDPQKFEDRVYLGDEQAKKNCLYGAYVEYSAALAIHNDPAVLAKRAEIIEKMAVSDNSDPNGAFYIRMAKREEALQPTVGDNSIDFASYLANLQNTVRDHWTPAHGEADEKIDVSLTIAVDGQLSNIAVAHSTGDKEADQAAVDAVKKTARAAPLPMKASVPIEVTLHFEQGKGESGQPRKIVH